MELKAKHRGYIHQLQAVILMNLSVFIFGSILAWPSTVLYEIHTTGQPLKLTNDEVSWTASSVFLGAMAVPFGAAYLADQAGRKLAVLIMCVMPLVSWLLILYPLSALQLCVARFLAGMWGGTIETLAPMYLAEVAETEVRGRLNSIYQMNISAGMLFGYLLGHFSDYNMTAAISAVIPLLYLLLFWSMPETPSWLLMKEENEAAQYALAWLRGEEDPQGERVVNEMKRLTLGLQNGENQTRAYKELFNSKGQRKAVLIVQFVCVGQKLSGITAIVSFFSLIVPENTINDHSPDTFSAVFALVSLASTVFATMLIDYWGRKPLLIVSLAGCSIATIVVAFWFCLEEMTNVSTSRFNWVPLAGMLLFSATYSIGLGPIPSILRGEMFPTRAHSFGSALTVTIMSFVSFAVNYSYKYVERYIGLYAVFSFFSVSSAITLLFVIKFMIETKGKTFIEIHTDLEN